MTDNKYRIRPLFFLTSLILFTIYVYIKAIIDLNNTSKEHCFITEETDVQSITDQEVTSTRIILFIQEDCKACSLMEVNLCTLKNSLEHGDKVAFYKVDCHNSPSLCAKYNISGVPTTLILNNNKEHKRILGITSPSNLYMIYQRVNKQKCYYEIY